ncbi:hypothetical protein CANCADRAFT_95529 [Tortispora caseinolytica NRRL Y-17796]|uniref:Enoyl reductase (ER) domain-containing protein n=1 Tax=Tortispora caseinolytica NRRL Y-17796 TaxID=767744 RepID=A0A1E4TMD6_9ASCO|nr:hypothetical protein CANCADRAFT_95529 [Tortispora caseinolytica NRRL Y-17796]
MPYPEKIDALGITNYDNWKTPSRFQYVPQEFRDYDVDIEIEACAICGSDVHVVKSNWGRPYVPVAVGHEIIGRVVKVGPESKKKFQVGDRVGVGAQCDCDNTCSACIDGFQNNCIAQVGTYFGKNPKTGFNTIGGNASHIRVNSEFVFKIPDSLETKYAAPMLCGGITGFAPLLNNNVGKGMKVGVVGIGGIGHMTVLFAKALGAEVTAISRSRAKEQDAKKLGADHYCVSSDESSLKQSNRTLDLIVNTTSSLSESDISTIMSLLKPRGKLCVISAPPISETLKLKVFPLLMMGYSIEFSAIGSPSQIQFMLDFAAKHQIKPWIETYDINEKSLGDAWQKVDNGDVKFRAVMVGYDKYFGREARM